MTRRWPVPRLFRGPRAEGVQEFQVPCECGAVLSGNRSARLQALRCPRCGRRVAVLPRNPRPRPKALTISARKALGRWQRGPLERGEPVAGGPGGEPARRSRLAKASATPATAASPRVVAREKLKELATAARGVATRHLTIPRVLAAVVAVLALATISWSWRSSRASRLEREIQASLASGDKALDEGRLPEALAEYRTAADAARRWGVSNGATRRALQMEQESGVWSHLALDSLVAWLEQAVRRGDAERSRRDFRRAFAGRTAIFEGALAPGEQGSGPRLDWTLFAEGATLEAALDAESIGSLRVAGQRPSVVFAAELEDVEPVGEGAWRLRFKPHTTVLLTAEAPLVRAGRPADESLRETLARQRGWLQIEETP